MKCPFFATCHYSTMVFCCIVSLIQPDNSGCQPGENLWNCHSKSLEKFETFVILRQPTPMEKNISMCFLVSILCFLNSIYQTGLGHYLWQNTTKLRICSNESYVHIASLKFSRVNTSKCYKLLYILCFMNSVYQMGLKHNLWQNATKLRKCSNESYCMHVRVVRKMLSFCMLEAKAN